MTVLDGSPSGLRVVVLAAGSSTRFGSTKQLVAIDGEPMVLRVVRAAVELAGVDAVTVVVGADAARVAHALRPTGVATVLNPDYAAGMAGSIRAGVAHASAAAGGLLILLADQVAVTVGDLRALVQAWRLDPGRLVVAEYSGILGVPAIFPRRLFADLLGLAGDRGARGLIARHAADAVPIAMPTAALDIDTPDDLRSY